MRTITTKELEQALAHRINETEAEIQALRSVAINVNHKALTNRTVESTRHGVEVKIGDYIGLGKALYVYYEFRKDGVRMQRQSLDITAYSYNNEDGTEIGTVGFLRQSRTITPSELRTLVDSVIEGREATLIDLKRDLANAKKFVTKYNKLNTELSELLDSATWATRSVLK